MTTPDARQCGWGSRPTRPSARVRPATPRHPAENSCGLLRPRPGCQLTLNGHEQPVEQHRHDDRQDGTDDQWSGEELLDALDDERAETALADQAGDGDQAD